MITEEEAPKVCEDGWHCDPSCPFLQPGECVSGRCGKHDVDLDWYDYYIAFCTQGSLENPKTDEGK